MSEVQVTNRNKFPLPGRYAGVNYVFPPGKPTAVSREAANHIFGLGQADKTRALNCLGILKGKVTYAEALAVLEKVSFAEGRMVYEGAEQHPPEPPPAQPEPPPKPAEDEEEEEGSKESGVSPGAPRSPGRKSEGGGVHTSSPSDDLKPPPTRRQW